MRFGEIVSSILVITALGLVLSRGNAFARIIQSIGGQSNKILRTLQLR